MPIQAKSLYRSARMRGVAAWTALLSLALGLRVGFAILVPSIDHPDEIFQTLEPAHRLAFGYGIVSWEWRLGIRSWVLPTFLAGVMRAGDWLGGRGYLYGVIFVLSLLSLTAVWFAYAWARRASGREAGWIAAGASAVFLGLVYFAPRALSEVVAAHVLLPGLYLGTQRGGKHERRRLFLAAFFCGLAASLRIQLIPAAVFAAVYFCFPGWRRRAPAVASGFLLPVMMFGLVDKLTWSYPWQSFVLNFRINALQGKSLEYGTEAWYWYGLVLLLLVGPVLVFAVQGARRSPFLAAVAAVILVSHSLLAHKEVRFVYPILPMAITLSAMGFVDVADGMKQRFRWLARPGATVAAGVVALTLSSGLVLVEMVGWCQPAGAVLGMDRLSGDAGLCGVGFYRIDWWNLGGYAHLHRNVPILRVESEANLSREAPEFNALIAPREGEPYAGFAEAACWNGICVYRRPGACVTPQSDDTLDAYLRRTGR